VFLDFVVLDIVSSMLAMDWLVNVPEMTYFCQVDI